MVLNGSSLQLGAVLAWAGEDEGGSISPDEFFGPLGAFLTRLGEVEREVGRRREAEERRLKSWTATTGRRSSSALLFTATTAATSASPGVGGDFDRLVAALQSGELYSGQLNRLRASFKAPKRREKTGWNPRPCLRPAHIRQWGVGTGKEGEKKRRGERATGARERS